MLELVVVVPEGVDDKLDELAAERIADASQVAVAVVAADTAFAVAVGIVEHMECCYVHKLVVAQDWLQQPRDVVVVVDVVGEAVVVVVAAAGVVVDAALAVALAIENTKDKPL